MLDRKMTDGQYRSMSVVSTTTPYILALDVGTTTIRCYIYDKDINIKGFSHCQVGTYCKYHWSKTFNVKKKIKTKNLSF